MGLRPLRKLAWHDKKKGDFCRRAVCSDCPLVCRNSRLSSPADRTFMASHFHLAPIGWPRWARWWIVAVICAFALSLLAYLYSAWLASRHGEVLSIPCVPANDTGRGVQFEFREAGQLPTLIYVPAGQGRHVSMRNCSYVSLSRSKPLMVKWRYEDNPDDITYDYTYSAMLHLARPGNPAMLLLKFEPQGSIAARYLGSDEVQRMLDGSEPEPPGYRSMR